jgi:integrase
VEAVSTQVIERWVASFDGSVRTRNKLLIQLHGILGRAKKAHGLRINAAAEVEKFPQRSSGDIEVFSPEEVWALGRTAANEQDGAIYLTAAFTGLRMGELLALCWRDIDFTGDTGGRQPSGVGTRGPVVTIGFNAEAQVTRIACSRPKAQAAAPAH